VGTTRRQGVGSASPARPDRWRFGASYSYINAVPPFTEFSPQQLADAISDIRCSPAPDSGSRGTSSSCVRLLLRRLTLGGGMFAQDN
jgi:hypothetical protein